MDADKFIEFAPYIIVVLLFFWQNRVFVRPSDLEKKHREILKDVKSDYVELNAYKEFQHHVMQEFENIRGDFNSRFDTLDKKIDDNFDRIENILQRRRKDD